MTDSLVMRRITLNMPVLLLSEVRSLVPASDAYIELRPELTDIGGDRSNT
jgi:hypothetical protein